MISMAMVVKIWLSPIRGVQSCRSSWVMEGAVLAKASIQTARAEPALLQPATSMETGIADLAIANDGPNNVSVFLG